MDQVMNIEEIEKQFDNEWVLIADPEVDEQLNVLGGNVIHHHKDRIAFDRESIKYTDCTKHWAVVFTGAMQDPIIMRLLVGFQL